jgi:nicotinamidase/pyrazinamidase
VQGTEGAEFHPDLDTTQTELIIRKGFRREIDSYSAFFENDNETPTGLTGYLQERGIDTLYLAGLATDFCVKWSALDGVKQGFDVYVIEDATRGIDANGSLAAAWEEMNDAGVQVISSNAAETLA